MLIRLANHHVLNPHLIDKLIVIRGLPYEWIFKKVEQGDQLLPPWEPDNDVNIPNQIRNMCTPITYVKWFPPIRHYDANYSGFWDKRTVLGLRLDYGFGPAQEMWHKIEDYIEGTIPRTEKMPVPILVAPDQKSNFAPHLAKKSDRGGGGLMLIPQDIPIVDLDVYRTPVQTITQTTVTVASTPEPIIKIEPKEAEILRCEVCGFETDKTRALRMHTMKKHPKQEKVAV